MSSFRHLFFDLDRTLWDMERNARETLAELFSVYELDKKGIGSAEIFIEHYNHYNNILWDRYRRKLIDKDTLRALRFKQALAHFGIHDKELAGRFEKDYIAEAPRKKHLIPGAKEMLERLRPDFRLHIITNGFPEVQHHKISNSGLEPYFDIVVTSEACGYTKPEAEIFDYALRKAAGKKEEALMIGDDLHVDIVGARNAGWKQVFFNPGCGKHEEPVTFEITALETLPSLLIS